MKYFKLDVALVT